MRWSTPSCAGERCQWIVVLARFHCSGWDEDVRYHSDGSDPPSSRANHAKRQREQRAAALQGRHVSGAQKVKLLMIGPQAATGCGEEVHSYQRYIGPVIHFRMKSTNPKTHPNKPSPPQWRLGTSTTSLRLLTSSVLEK